MRSLELLLRNLHFWFAAGLGVLLTSFAFAILRSALAESLWLDELHTSWSISGSWQEIASRSAAGNQTPLYFWISAFTQQTLGHPGGQHPEWILRMPSVIAWLIAIGLVIWQVGTKARICEPCERIFTKEQDGNLVGIQSWLFALCIASWIVLDRLQWFFATEARPYAFVQLLSLAGWCCVEAIVQSDRRLKLNNPPISMPRSTKLVGAAPIVVWCVLSVTSIYMHLTAILPVTLQWLVGSGLAWWKIQKQGDSGETGGTSGSAIAFQAKWTFAAIGVGLALLPILQLAFPVWHRRSQWAAFASDVSIYRATSMFPFVPVLLCVLIAGIIDRAWHKKSQRLSIASETRWIWWSAMLGPWLVAWMVTALGIAPIFHQRFVIASACPIFIVGALELLRCRHIALRWIACLAVAIAIVYSQGSSSVWRAGSLVGNLRGEDWRAATQWVHERIEPGESLLCSSGLIEANASATSPLNLPLAPAFAEYLSFPLLGQYRIADSTGQNATVTPLLGDHRQWASQTMALLNSNPNQPTRLWMFYRGAPGRLKTKLSDFIADLKLKDIEVEAAEPHRFGNVFVVELKRS